MQYAGDTDLAEALASPQVRITPVLEFDWARDGLYAHTYSDLSDVLAQADIETATFTSDIPDSINAAVGASSGQMTLTLHGRRNAEEPTAAQLMNRFFTTVPSLLGVRREGTPVRYSRRVRTKYGYLAIRQFTGWISEVPTVDEATGEVTVVCSDVYDLQTSPVTLPRWGKGPSADDSSQAVGGKYSYVHPIESSWAMEHALLLGGRSRGPAVQGDTVVYWSCAGSFLPSVGSIADTTYSGHAISYEHDPADWQVDGRTGALMPKASTNTGNDRLNFGRCRSAVPVVVPRDGVSGDANKFSEISFWCYSDGSGSTSGANGSQIVLNLDSSSSGIVPGFMAAFVNRAGIITFQVSESTNISGARTWSWGPTAALAAGWHYVQIVRRWVYNNTNAGSVDIWIDGVSVGFAFSGTSGVGYRYQVSLTNSEFGNVAFVKVELAPLQYVQIRHSATTIATVLTQGGPTMRDGAQMAWFTQSQGQLTFMPDRYNVAAWDLLKEMVKGELGLLWTDEYGYAYFDIRRAAYHAEDAQIAGAMRIPRAKLGPLTINPNANLYRNAATLSTTYSGAVRGVVWTSDDPKERYTPAGAADSEIVDMDADFISCYLSARRLSYIPDTTGVPLNANWVASTRADDTTLEASMAQVFENVVPLVDQRRVQILWQNNSANAAYVGAYQNANQAAWFLTGTKLAPKKNGQFTYTNTAEVAATGGTQVVEIAASDWLQGEAQAETIGWALLADTVNPAPLLDPVSLAADPRRQLGDFAIIDGGHSMTGDLVVQIIGMRRVDLVGGGTASFSDQITLRVVRTPGVARWDDASVGWDEGVWDD